MYRVEIDFPVQGTRSFSPGSNLLSISEITRAVQPDRSFENSSVTVTFHSAFWNDLMLSEDRYIAGAALRVFDGEETIFTGSVSDFPRSSKSRFIIKADTRNLGLSDRVNRVITKEEFPDVSSEHEGKYSNIVAGTALSTDDKSRGMLTAYRTGTGRYLAAWHHLTSLYGVFDKEGTELTASLDNNADGRAYIICTSEEQELFFNCKGIDEPNPAKAFKEICSGFADFSLDSASFTQAGEVYDERGYNAFVLLIDDDISWSDFIRRFSVNFDCMVFPALSGEIKIRVLDWGRECPAKVFGSIYINDSDFQQWRDIASLFSKYRRMYCYDFRKKAFEKKPEDVSVSTAWKTGTGSMDLRYHVSDTTSRDVTTRQLYFNKAPLVWYSFTIPVSMAKGFDLGDLIKIEYNSGFFPKGWRLVQVYRYQYRDKVCIEGLDVTALNKRTIILEEENDQDCVLLKDEASPECEVLL